MSFGKIPTTVIEDIRLDPNGEDSAYFKVVGKEYTCGFDVKYGGIGGTQSPGWIQFSGYGGHSWRIRQK